MSKQSLKFRAIRSAITLPVVILLIIPAVIAWVTDSFQPGWGLNRWLALFLLNLGVFIFGSGIMLIVSTARLFTHVGEGTLAPWDPPKKLVIEGPYRYVRNPMHSGVFLALYGEGLFLGSAQILIFATIAFVFHWFYIPLTEEKWLAEKFGEDYQVYKNNVPRWIPRFTPWQKDNK